MDGAISKITETASDAIKNANEVIRERLFSPMYFYFLISWVISNWKFVYVLFFVDEETILRTQWMLKVDYLAQMYCFGFWSIMRLFIIPALASLIFVWWLSILSARFYKKHEEHQMEKRSIKRAVEYREKVEQVKSEREIREITLDTKIKFEDHKEFNKSIDDNFDEVSVAGISMLPSEVLYRTDYEAYKELAEEFRDKVLSHLDKE